MSEEQKQLAIVALREALKIADSSESDAYKVGFMTAAIKEVLSILESKQ